MKRILAYSILTILCCSSIYAQKLSLTDLTTLCSKKNWEDVNQTLLAKNWTYYESEKGSTYKYNTITWSFNKDYYSDKAQAWFYLYTYEGYPNKISYSVFNKESYSIIQNSISSAGFKLVNSEIEDNQVISTYGNTLYTLEISTEKRKDDDWSDRSTTAYRITLIKKAGIYDPDNGKKTDSYYDGTTKAEYTLVNGKLNGILKTYYENSNLKKTGNYVNGIENGLFKEYDENGNLEAEYSMSNGEFNGSLKTYYSNGKLKKSGSYLKGKEHGNFFEYDEYGTKDAEYVMANGMKNGVLKIYEDGKIDASTTFKDDSKNGQRIEYYYNDETGKLQLKQIVEYLNDEKNGTSKLFFIEDDNTERLLKFENYTKDIKNGSFQDVKGDSLIVGSYKNDELHGEYKIYRDFVKTLIGGVIRTDISKLTLTNEGSYFEGLESGYWKNYDLTGTLRNEGRFSNGKETGEWKYYYTNWTDGKGNSEPYSKQLFLVQNYSNGELDGKSTRYSYLNEEEYPCSEIDENKNPLDTCKRYVYQKVFETAFYKNDKLNGPFELRDSINGVIAKGNFKDDLKDGEWLHRYSDKDVNDETYFIYQKGNYTKDKRDGKWVKYYTEGKIAETFNYRNDELHGEYIAWNNQNKPREKKQFNYGKLTELITYDSLGVNPQNKYEIYDEKYNSYKCRRTEYLESGYAVQEYWLKKDKEIDPHWFELTFLFAIDKKLSDGTTGYKDGEFKLFNSNNQPIVTGKYYKEDRIGLWTFYFYDQNVKIESNLSQDKRTDEKYFTLNGDLFSGEFIYNDEANGIIEERKIKDGLRNGKTIYIDTKTKKTIKKESYKNGELK
ncbi:MAG: hypothetical protein LC109_02420 [Bacteroidia bacterium]|nr:hypothetical protein [Bacteroidia bacterium]